MTFIKVAVNDSSLLSDSILLLLATAGKMFQTSSIAACTRNDRSFFASESGSRARGVAVAAVKSRTSRGPIPNTVRYRVEHLLLDEV